MRACAHCGGELEQTFRFCPWCAAPQRLKVVDYFAGDPRIEPDRDKALRVSRYLAAPELDRHVRFSVWNAAGEAEAAVSLAEAEADRLARFLLDPGTAPAPALGRRPLVEHLRRTLSARRS